MGTAIFTRCLAVIFTALVTVGIPFSSAVAQSDRGPHWPEGCQAKGVSPPPDSYLPALWGWVIVSDEHRNAEQLAATFPDPADALARLNAWCWLGQAERVYTADQLTVDVSVHDFSGTEGPALAQRWFAYQRANELGLQWNGKTQEQLEEDLNAGGLGKVNIEALDDTVILTLHNDAEYTLYARRNQSDLVVRVSVSGDPSAGGRSHEVMAYWVLAQVLHMDLFPPRGA